MNIPDNIKTWLDTFYGSEQEKVIKYLNELTPLSEALERGDSEFIRILSNEPYNFTFSKDLFNMVVRTGRQVPSIVLARRAMDKSVISRTKSIDPNYQSYFRIVLGQDQYKSINDPYYSNLKIYIEYPHSIIYDTSTGIDRFIRDQTLFFNVKGVRMSVASDLRINNRVSKAYLNIGLKTAFEIYDTFIKSSGDNVDKAISTIEWYSNKYPAHFGAVQTQKLNNIRRIRSALKRPEFSITKSLYNTDIF